MTILEQEQHYGVGFVLPSGETELRHWGCVDAATKTVTEPVPKLHCAVCGKRIQHFSIHDASVVPIVD